MVKDHVIGVNVSKDTKEDIEKAADRQGLSTAGYIRHKIKTEILKPKVEA